MSWSLKGARNLSKVIIAQKNNELKDLLSQTNCEFEENENATSEDFRQIDGELDELSPKQGKLPALEGLEAGKS